MERGPPQDAHSVLPHHVLARQHLQQRRLACGVAALIQENDTRQAATNREPAAGAAAHALAVAHPRHPQQWLTRAVGAGQQAARAARQREGQPLNGGRAAERECEVQAAHHNRILGLPLAARHNRGHGGQLCRCHRCCCRCCCWWWLDGFANTCARPAGTATEATGERHQDGHCSWRQATAEQRRRAAGERRGQCLNDHHKPCLLVVLRGAGRPAKGAGARQRCAATGEAAG